MKLKTNLKQIFFQITGLRIYKKLPFGLDPFYDLKFQFKDYSFNVFFDVGANVGQSVSHIRAYFPKAEILCFEPIRKTFEILKENTANQKINYHQFALGAENGDMKIFIDQGNQESTRNSLVKPNISNLNNVLEENIKILTLDYFCSQNFIHNIDYLKIDTEGYDLEVLRGGVESLQNQSVAFIEVEVGMNPENTFHAGFAEVKQFLESFSYRLYGIYDQTQEWPTNTPILRRVNALFISEAVYKKNNRR